MGFVHGKNSRLLLADSLFSGFLRDFEHGDEIEMADSTTFGVEGHTFVPGLESGTLSINGLMDDDATVGGQNERLTSALRSADGSVITSAPAGLAVGEQVHMIEARETNYAVSTPVADLVSFSASWQAEGQVDKGRVLRAHGAVSATEDGTGVDNTALSSDGAAAHLHVTANTRDGSTTVKVQHSVDNSVFVDLISFAAVAAGDTTSERLTVTGTVNRYLRAQTTLAGTTGSITLAVAAARR